jgi:hypothetical protein
MSEAGGEGRTGRGTGAGAGVAAGWRGEYITAYIIRTMRDGARISYLEISARFGLCQGALLLLLRALLAGRAARLADLQVPVMRLAPGAYFA